MKNTLITFVLTALLFISGILAYQYISNISGGYPSISGIVQYYEPNLTISADAPKGYYIESSAVSRIYLKYDKISQYLNKHINARGALSDICGNDGGSCYPLIEVQGDITSQ